LTQERAIPLTEETEKLPFDRIYANRLPQLDGIRCLPGYLLLTIPELVAFPNFRINSTSEGRDGSERLVTIDFTVAPPLDPKAPISPVLAGKMQLRPDAYWTLKTATFELNQKAASCRSGRMTHCTVSNTYYDDLDKKALPKEVTCAASVITRDGKLAEETTRTTFEFSKLTQVPAERLSLTQFGMAEREPIVSPATDEPTVPEGPAPRGKQNFLVAQTIGIPPYVWATGGGMLLLLVGVSIHFWNARPRPVKPGTVASDQATDGPPVSSNA